MSRRAVAAAVVAVVAAVCAALAWRSDATSIAARPLQAGEPLDGATLFEVKGCVVCHAGGPDPDLSDAATWAGERRPGMSAEEYLAESIRDPGAFPPGQEDHMGYMGAMPQLGLSDEEVDALVDYLLGAGHGGVTKPQPEPAEVLRCGTR